MPGKRTRRRGKTSRQILKFPLLYNITVAGQYTSKLETLKEAFDQARTFRVVGFNYEIRSDDRTFPYQFALFSPISSTDVNWSSPLKLAASALRRGYHRNPSSLWYPSDTALTTPIFALIVDCYDKAVVPDGMCLVTLHIEVGTREQNPNCPRVVLPDIAPSGLVV